MSYHKNELRVILLEKRENYRDLTRLRGRGKRDTRGLPYVRSYEKKYRPRQNRLGLRKSGLVLVVSRKKGKEVKYK